MRDGFPTRHLVLVYLVCNDSWYIFKDEGGETTRIDACISDALRGLWLAGWWRGPEFRAAQRYFSSP